MDEKCNIFGMVKQDLSIEITNILKSPSKSIEDTKTLKELKKIVLKYKKTYFPFDDLPNCKNLGFFELGDIIRSYRKRLLNQEHKILRLKLRIE